MVSVHTVGRVVFSCLVAGGIALHGAAQDAADRTPTVAEPTHDTPLNRETFAQWRAYLSPGEQAESWRDIPWRASFWAGVMDAQKQRKPVLLWAMNGHPLGCT